jgi:hypothetical protein
MARRIEASHQEAFMHWIALQPNISNLVWHCPNGGRRTYEEARAFKRMGVKPGVPDIQVAVPSGEYHGLFIEFKSKHGKLIESQKKMHKHLIEAGYKVDTVYDWHEARVIVSEYIKGTKYDRCYTVQERNS